MLLATSYFHLRPFCSARPMSPEIVFGGAACITRLHVPTCWLGVVERHAGCLYRLLTAHYLLTSTPPDAACSLVEKWSFGGHVCGTYILHWLIWYRTLKLEDADTYQLSCFHGNLGTLFPYRMQPKNVFSRRIL